MIISKLQGITPALPGGAPGPLEDQLHLARLYSRPDGTSDASIFAVQNIMVHHPSSPYIYVPLKSNLI